MDSSPHKEYHMTRNRFMGVVAVPMTDVLAKLMPDRGARLAPVAAMP